MDGLAPVAAVGGIVAGAIAAVSGFGIGSVLTPLFGASIGLKLGVVAASVPHVAGTTLRLWMVRGHLRRDLLLTFGLASAVGGLAGAALQSVATSPALTVVFASLLIFAGLGAVTGYASRLRFGRRGAVIGGALSGFLGGLVGNQGGIRSAALLGFDVPREAFIATSTAVALIVDAVRVPVYLVTQGDALRPHLPLLVVAVVAVTVGTLVGTRVLRGVPERVFRPVVGGLLIVLALFTITTAR